MKDYSPDTFLIDAIIFAWYHAWKYMYSPDEYKQLATQGRAPHIRHKERQDKRAHVKNTNA